MSNPLYSPSQFEIDNDDFNASFEPAVKSNRNIGISAVNNKNSDDSTTWYTRLTSCFQISALSSYFDVDTIDIQERVEGSIRHCNEPFQFRESILNKEGKAPDLYGPFWIGMTLVFFLAVTSNTSKYLKTESADVEYDIRHLVDAFSTVFVLIFALPIGIFLISKFLPTPLVASSSLVEIISIYGYSLIPFIPATVLCLVPSILMEWIILVSAASCSLLLVLRNLIGTVVHPQRTIPWIGSIIIIACHGILCLILKFKFYHHKSHGSKMVVDDDGMTANGGGSI